MAVVIFDTNLIGILAKLVTSLMSDILLSMYLEKVSEVHIQVSEITFQRSNSTE